MNAGGEWTQSSSVLLNFCSFWVTLLLVNTSIKFCFRDVYCLLRFILFNCRGFFQTGLEPNRAKDDFEDPLACLMFHSTLGVFFQPVGKFSSSQSWISANRCDSISKFLLLAIEKFGSPVITWTNCLSWVLVSFHFSLFGLIFSVTTVYTAISFNIEECNHKEVKNQKWNSRDHIQFESGNGYVFF